MSGQNVFIDKGLIVAMILLAKNKYFNESYVSFDECNLVINKLREKISKANLNIIISENLEQYYFEVISDVIVINTKFDIDLEFLLERYLGCIPMDTFDKFNGLISDGNFFYEAILDAKLSNIISSTKNENVNFKTQRTDFNTGGWTLKIIKGNGLRRI